MWMENFQMFKLDLEKAERGTRDQIANMHWIVKKKKKVSEFQKKHLLLLHWLCRSLWLWITTNGGKFLKRWEYQNTLPASWEICMQVKKQQLNRTRHGTSSTSWFQIGKGVPQGCYSCDYLFNMCFYSNGSRNFILLINFHSPLEQGVSRFFFF